MSELADECSGKQDMNMVLDARVLSAGIAETENLNEYEKGEIGSPGFIN